MKKYFEEINDYYMHYAMANTLSRMCKNKAVQEIIENDLELKTYCLKVLEDNKIDLLKFIGKTFGQSHKGKMQIYDANKKVHYIFPDLLDDYISKSFKTKAMLDAEKYTKLYFVCRTALLQNSGQYTFDFDSAIKLLKTMNLIDNKKIKLLRQYYIKTLSNLFRIFGIIFRI